MGIMAAYGWPPMRYQRLRLPVLAPKNTRTNIPATTPITNSFKIIMPHHPSIPAEFCPYRAVVKKILTGKFLYIEHVGISAKIFRPPGLMEIDIFPSPLPGSTGPCRRGLTVLLPKAGRSPVFIRRRVPPEPYCTALVIVRQARPDRDYPVGRVQIPGGDVPTGRVIYPAKPPADLTYT